MAEYVQNIAHSSNYSWGRDPALKREASRDFKDDVCTVDEYTEIGDISVSDEDTDTETFGVCILDTDTEVLYLRGNVDESHVEPRVKRSRPEYEVWKYVVPRQEYGRLDYNATIAHRIYKGLQKTDLHVPDVPDEVPDIIKSKDVSFLAVVPTASDKIKDDEQMTNVTESIRPKFMENGWQARTRWIFFFSKEDVPNEIPKQREAMYLTGTVGNLKKRSDVKKFLTFSFENEIFDYTERVSKHVETCMANNMEQRNKFGMINLDIRSLLARKLPEHGNSTSLTSYDQQTDKKKFQFPSSRNIEERLQKESPQKCDIKGVFNTTDGLLIAVKQPEKDNDRMEIASWFENYFSKNLDDTPQIIWVESIETSKLTARGDEFINNEKRGTLGCFGRRKDKQLVAITAGHCAQTGDTIQIQEQEGIRTEFGRCAESYSQDNVDIAIIDVNEDMRSRCKMKFQNENGEDCEASVFQGGALRTWPVHKIGAETGATLGVVYCGNARLSKKEGIVICGNTDVFAKAGDSGSIVFFYDPNDIDHKTVTLLSIVSEDIKIEAQGAIPEGLSREPILTQSLKDRLDKVKT